MVSDSIQEYLEIIYKLEQETSPVTTSALAKRLGVSAASVSEMMAKLAEQGLVTREPYKGVVLTADGRSQALALIRRHRLWERFLTDILNLSWDQVHEEACRLEHATSPLVEERLAQFLGEPETCPHGHPMPTAAGELDIEAGCPLAELIVGQRATILRVPEGDPTLLQYLDDLGLKPGITLQVEAVAPFQGPLTVQVGEARHVLGRELASKIIVQSL